MRIERREALLALLFAPYMQDTFVVRGGDLLVQSQHDFKWHMDGVRDFIIVRNGETVTISAADVFEALKGETPR